MTRWKSHAFDSEKVARYNPIQILLVLSFAPRGFSPATLAFPSPQKPLFPNSNSTRNQVDEEALCGCATSKSLFIYLFIHHHPHHHHHHYYFKEPTVSVWPYVSQSSIPVCSFHFFTICVFTGCPPQKQRFNLRNRKRFRSSSSNAFV